MPLPNAPTNLVLEPSSDTGVSSTDGITSDTSPIFDGQGIPNASVTLFDDSNDDGVQDNGEATLGTATVGDGGTFSVQAALSVDGSYTVRATQTTSDGTSNGSDAVEVDLDTTVDPPTASFSGPGITNGNGDVPLGGTATLTLQFDEAVYVQMYYNYGPEFGLTNGGTAYYSGGSGTDVLSFAYTAGEGEDTSDLGLATYYTFTNASTGERLVQITDAAGNQEDVAANFDDIASEVPGTLKVDTVSPTVLSFTADQRSSASPDTRSFTITFSEPVTGVAKDEFVFDRSTTDGSASIVSVTGTGTTYTVNVDIGASGSVGSIALDYLGSSAVQDLAGNAYQTPYLGPQTTYDGGNGPDAVAIDDFNGDGKPDVVVADSQDWTVSVYAGNGDTTLQGPQASAVDDGPNALAVADFNGDGKLDVATANYDGTVSILLGNGDGTFQSPLSLDAGGTSASGIAATDLNGDGIPDLIVNSVEDPYTGESSVSVLLGNGDGTFTQSDSLSNGDYFPAVAAADVNGDGKPDILVADEYNVIDLFTNNGDGTFDAAGTVPFDDEPVAIAVGDLNGDGSRDIVIADGDNTAVSVALGNGDGTFAPAADFDLGGHDLYSVAIADINGDGKPDIVAGQYFDGSYGLGHKISLLLGNGDGTFQSPIQYDAGYSPAAVATGDLDADGRTDVVVTNKDFDNSFSVLPNVTQTIESSPAIACYCTGTRILTDRGEVAIEDLAAGSLLITASGERRSVRWIGHRRIAVTRHPDPHAVWPIRVSAGAFGANLPTRDLWMSPGHNVFADGVLMPVRVLVNGATVVQAHIPEVTYWHIELDSHDVILAEGLPAESYLDTGNRAAFENGGLPMTLHPDFDRTPANGPQPARYAPVRTNGPDVAAVRARLLARALDLGNATTSSHDLHIAADGRRIEAIVLGPKRLAFVLPPGCTTVDLVSRTFVPRDIDPTRTDSRMLGVCIKRLAVDGADVDLREVLPGEAWHPVEMKPAHVQRWTRGAVPLPVGTRLVIVDLAADGLYWLEHGDKVMALRA